jgi:hypothetical protein
MPKSKKDKAKLPIPGMLLRLRSFLFELAEKGGMCVEGCDRGTKPEIG